MHMRRASGTQPSDSTSPTVSRAVLWQQHALQARRQYPSPPVRTGEAALTDAVLALKAGGITPHSSSPTSAQPTAPMPFTATVVDTLEEVGGGASEVEGSQAERWDLIVVPEGLRTRGRSSSASVKCATPDSETQSPMQRRSLGLAKSRMSGPSTALQAAVIAEEDDAGVLAPADEAEELSTDSAFGISAHSQAAATPISQGWDPHASPASKDTAFSRPSLRRAPPPPPTAMKRAPIAPPQRPSDTTFDASIMYNAVSDVVVPPSVAETVASPSAEPPSNVMMPLVARLLPAHTAAAGCEESKPIVKPSYSGIMEPVVVWEPRDSLGANASRHRRQSSDVPVPLDDNVPNVLSSIEHGQYEKYSKAQVIADLPAFLRSRLKAFLGWPWFDRFILLIIATSCIILALDTPYLDHATTLGQIITASHYVFAIVFATEAVLKMIALGINMVNPDSYFRSGWNILDFAIAVESVVSISLGSGSSFSAIRAIRALRPLRTVTRIAGLRTVIDGLLHAVLLLSSTCLAVTYFFFMFGVTAVQIWAGKFHNHCFEIATGAMRSDEEYFCGGVQQCDAAEFCISSGPAPAYGFGVMHFDNIFNAAIVLFASVSREGWTTVMRYAQEVSNQWSWLFFVPLVFLGSFILMQLTLAVVMSSYVESCAQQEAEQKREAAKQDALLRVRRIAQKSHAALSRTSPTKRASIPAKSVRFLPVTGEVSPLAPFPVVNPMSNFELELPQLEAGDAKPSAASAQSFVGTTPAPRPGLKGGGRTPPSRADPTDTSRGSGEHAAPGDTSDDIRHPQLAVKAVYRKPLRDEPIAQSTARTSIESDIAARYGRDNAEDIHMQTAARIADALIESAVCENIGSAYNAETVLDQVADMNESELGSTASTLHAAHHLRTTSAEKHLQSTSLPGNVPAAFTAALLGSNTPKAMHRYLPETPGRPVDEAGRPWQATSPDAQAVAIAQSWISTDAPTIADSSNRTAANNRNYPGGLAKPLGWCKRLELRLCDPRTRTVRWWTRNLSDPLLFAVETPIFNAVMGVLIFANAVILALQQHGISAAQQSMLDDANFAFVIIFSVELLLKLVAYGIVDYCTDGFRTFDGIVVLFSLVDVLPLYEGRYGVSIIRLARAFRLMRLAAKWRSMQVIIAVIRKALPSFRWVGLLFALGWFIFALLGLQLFGDAYGESSMPAANFSTMHEALLTVFQLLVGEALDTIMYEHISFTSSVAAVYFIVWILIGQYILLNLVLALILAGFESADPLMHELERQDQLRTAVLLVKDALENLEKRDRRLVSIRAKRLFASNKQIGARVKPPPRQSAETAIDNIGPFAPPRHDIAMTWSKGPDSAVSPEITGPRMESGADSTSSQADSTQADSTHNLMISRGRNGKDGRPPAPGRLGRATHTLAVAKSFVDLLQQSVKPAAGTLATTRPSAGIFVSRPTSPIVPPYTLPEQRTRSPPVAAASPTVDLALAGDKGEHAGNASAAQSHADVTSLDTDPAEGEEHIAANACGCLSPNGCMRSKIIRLVNGSTPVCWIPSIRRMVNKCLRFGKPDRVSSNTPFWRPVTLETIVLVAIVVSSLLLAVDSPQTADNGTLQHALLGLDVMFVVLFLVELSLKLIAKGIIMSRKAYLRDPYNVLDFIVIIVSAVDVVIELAGINADLRFWRTMRVIRSLRPLRLLSRHRGMRSVIDSLYFSSFPMMNILALLLLLWSIFAIAGVQLFSGALADCNDPNFPPDTPLSGCVGYFVDGTGLNVTREVVNMQQNFDTYFNAMLHLFICTTGESWPDVMHRLGGVTSPGYSADPGATWYFSYYHVLFITICVFLGLNLFIAVLFANFSTLQRGMDGLSLLTDRQREWTECQQILMTAKPIKLIAKPASGWRRQLWSVGHHHLFGMLMNSILVLNMCLLASSHWNQQRTLTEAIRWSNVCFVIIYAVEAAVKMLGFGIAAYWRDKWLRFELLIVCIGIVDVFTSLLSPSSTFTVILHLLRTIRGLRLVKAFRGLRLLVDILVGAIPSFASVGGVVLIVALCYAIAGVHLFGAIDLHEAKSMDMFANFLSTPNALMLLLRTATGEAWDSLMFDCVCEECGGGWYGYAYWLSYVVLMNFMLLQMFTMVIVDSYQAGERQRKGAAEQHIRAFRAVWRLFDPKGIGFIAAADLQAFLHKLPAPLGIPDGSTFSDFVRLTEKLQLHSWDGMVAFRDVLLNIHRVTYALGISDAVLSKVGSTPEQIRAHTATKIRKRLKQTGLKEGVLHALQAISVSSRRKPAAPLSGDQKRASFRASKAASLANAREVEMVTPTVSCVALSPTVMERRELNDVVLRELDLAQTTSVTSEPSMRLKPRPATNGATLYHSHFPTTDFSHPVEFVVVSQRIQQCFREWKERSLLHRHSAPSPPGEPGSPHPY